MKMIRHREGRWIAHRSKSSERRSHDPTQTFGPQRRLLPSGTVDIDCSLWGTVQCPVGRGAVSLVSTHYVPVAPSAQLWQPKMCPDTVHVPWGAEWPQVESSAPEPCLCFSFFLQAPSVEEKREMPFCLKEDSKLRKSTQADGLKEGPTNQPNPHTIQETKVWMCAVLPKVATSWVR